LPSQRPRLQVRCLACRRRALRVQTGTLSRVRPVALDRTTIQQACQRILDATWVPTPGFTMPNAKSYPWQWLWDSCFHVIAWAGLGDHRAVVELESLFALQLPNGFMPHMGYQTNPPASLHYWQSAGRSDITQPPMYGHALRVVAERGFRVAHLYDQADRALDYLFENRLDQGTGLLRVVHPWETGCDDSPRWDGLRPFQGRLPHFYERRRWYDTKRALVTSLQRREGAAVHNPDFDVCSIGFNALAAFNARELASLTNSQALLEKADELASAIDRRWDQARATWVDVCLAGPVDSSAVRTLDSLLPILVSERNSCVDAAFGEILSEAAFWRPFGPTGTAVDELSYNPNWYWRGPVWPQLSYLIMVAAVRNGRSHVARLVADSLIRGAVTSGFSEYWHPDTGKAKGATPQGWATLALDAVMTSDGL
jgi:hypothetical protein